MKDEVIHKSLLEIDKNGKHHIIGNFVNLMRKLHKVYGVYININHLQLMKSEKNGE